MYKLQAFGVLVLTLLAFSQASPVPSKKTFLQAVKKDVESLKNMNEVLKVGITFLVPTDVQDSCTVNALDCFSYILDGLQRKCKNGTVANTISNAMKNLDAFMGMDSKERKEKRLCYEGCKYSMKQRNTNQALEDFIRLLQQMYQADQ
ncbi:interleukin-15-like [Bufo gargarizans]|uniref:interleukin-15-like n=1 Tax=Bufo gargarizans TaxID=30331 RepID=UPI001CF426D6|nr:interleukin-15-like [Bufo gargarizans]